MAANQAENQLGISWHDSAWIPVLNNDNVLDYFCQRSNPFYDRTCNNEVVKMQRLDASQLQYMTGVEYVLIHAQDPILYVVRKQNRHYPNQVTFLATYYILAGIVYQCPDIGSLLNSRLLSTVNTLESAFDEAFSYARYSPSKGYWWQFKDKARNKTARKTQEKSSPFQRLRVDFLLTDLLAKFPPKAVQPPPTAGKNGLLKDTKDNDLQSVSEELSKTVDSKELIDPNSTKPISAGAINVRPVGSKLPSDNRQEASSGTTNDSKSLTPPTKKRKL